MPNGAILIGAEARRREPSFAAFNPSTNEKLPQDYSSANAQDVADACALAAGAFAAFAAAPPEQRASFVEAIAENILAIGDELIETAIAETGLPRARLEGERGRTVGQLRMFAQAIRAGDWLDATIDPAMPDRMPARRADLRRVNVALGPVAVFGASNFPLAFSVAGGDTASAFATGCPVIVKGHPAHPGTGELVASAIQRAVNQSGFPAGVFSFLPGAAHELGAALVADAHIKAAAFTGSRGGGLAMVEIARKREEPIPVFAEMSSINPVLLAPAALDARAETLAKAFVASLTLGSGQFCTNPGLVIALDSPALDRFVRAASDALAEAEPGVMLTPSICQAYVRGVAALEAADARRVGRGKESDAPNRGSGALFDVEAANFIANSALAHEVFGASSVVVRCRDGDEVARVVQALEGQLTATLHMDTDDEAFAARLLPLLQAKAGRVLANGWPTGVEVTHAMVHGGPFPATSDGRTTSVGTLAMMRFLRPVCYQDMPDSLLPPPLKAANPWKLSRRIDGKLVTP